MWQHRGILRKQVVDGQNVLDNDAQYVQSSALATTLPDGFIVPLSNSKSRIRVKRIPSLL